MQRDRQVRGRQHGARSLLRFDPGVGGTTAELDRVVGHSLSRRDHGPVRSGGLQHEHHVVLDRELPDRGPGERRADLLVGIADVGDRVVGIGPRLPQGLHGLEAGQESALHVRCSGTVGERAHRAEGPRRRGALVEHGVHVPDQQHSRAIPAPRTADHQIAELRFPVRRDMLPPLDEPPVLDESALAPVGDRIDAGGRVRPTIDIDHRAEFLCERGLPGLRERLQLTDIRHGGEYRSG